jgi:hypothetical protein
MHPCQKIFAALLWATPLVWLTAADSPPGLKAQLVTDETPEVAEVRSLAEKALGYLAGSLIREVNGAVAKSGPEGAVEVCHLKAVPVTNGTVAGLTRITAFKLTSLKLRSPANTPDPADQLVLDHYRELLANGDTPEPMVIQRVEFPAAAPEWRVYKPLVLLPKCAVCHGDAADQSEALRAKLAAHYPADQASGYKPGEWRGLLRVTVAATAAKKP